MRQGKKKGRHHATASVRPAPSARLRLRAKSATSSRATYSENERNPLDCACFIADSCNFLSMIMFARFGSVWITILGMRTPNPHVLRTQALFSNVRFKSVFDAI